jgi:hypothetical protein
MFRVVSASLATMDGPIRPELLAARALGIEWDDLTAQDRRRFVAAIKRAGFEKRTGDGPCWRRIGTNRRATPKDGDEEGAVVEAMPEWITGKAA